MHYSVFLKFWPILALFGTLVIVAFLDLCKIAKKLGTSVYKVFQAKYIMSWTSFKLEKYIGRNEEFERQLELEMKYDIL